MPAKTHMLTAAQYQALATGMPKFCPATIFTIGGQSYTTPQVVTLIQQLLAATLAVPPARADWLAAVDASRALEVESGETVKEVREIVALMFKNAPNTLAQLAIPPRKTPKPLSPEARVAANAKAKATRLARGTKAQRALVTGNVSGVTITPIITPSQAPAATPVTPAASPVVTPVVTGVVSTGITPRP